MKKEVTKQKKTTSVDKVKEPKADIENTKKRKSKRISKPEEEKRSKILNPILDTWVYMKNKYSSESPYTYIKHSITPEHKYSKLYQLVLSNDPIQDGLYAITDYEVGYVFDDLKKKTQIEIKPKKYDLKIGMYAENYYFETYEEMIDCLIKEGYTTREEVNKVLYNKKFHKDREEISLTFILNKRKGK